MVSEETARKNSRQTLRRLKVSVQKLVIGFLAVTSNQYWASADLLFLIKNIMWDGFYYFRSGQSMF